MSCVQAFWRPRSNSVQIGLARGSLSSQGACYVSPIVGRKETISVLGKQTLLSLGRAHPLHQRLKASITSHFNKM
jgi:hypothetical protein